MIYKLHTGIKEVYVSPYKPLLILDIYLHYL